MKATTARQVVAALEHEDVPFTFGIPGTHNIELYDALVESERVRPILVTDEQSASFMADGVWRASGHLGCVSVVPGAGLTHALSGIAEAFMDNVPMLVLGCGIRRDTGHAYQLHDVDQQAIVAPVVKATLRAKAVDEVYGVVRRACGIARSGAPGPVFVEIPAHLYLSRAQAELRFHEEPREPRRPEPGDVERAQEILEHARRPLVYVGLGAQAARPDLVALVEALQAPVSSTFQGKGVFPESHPLFLWPGFGDAAPPFVREVAATCDATLAIGCRFGEVATGSYGLRPPEPLIHVDVDRHVLGRNYPAALAVESDAGEFLRALRPRLARRSPDAALAAAIAKGRAALDGEDAPVRRDHGVDPRTLLRALQRRFGSDLIVTTDSGNGTFLAMESLRLDHPGRFLAPIDYSCMGYAIPAAIGAALARPGVPVVALAGDGAFLMTGLELLTAAQLEVPVAVFVLRDGELAQIAQFQQTALARKVCSHLPDFDLDGLVTALGVECVAVDDESGVDAVMDAVAATLSAGRPIVVDASVDYARKTWFTQGVVRTNLGRLSWPDRLRFVGRAIARRLVPA